MCCSHAEAEREPAGRSRAGDIPGQATFRQEEEGGYPQEERAADDAGNGRQVNQFFNWTAVYTEY